MITKNTDICRARVERAFEDINFFVAAEVYDYRLEFKAYECITSEGIPQFLLADEFSFTSTPNRADARVYISGSVRWDTCSNLRFDEQDECMLHFCSKEEAVNVGVLLGRIYDLAAEFIPTWDGD